MKKTLAILLLTVSVVGAAPWSKKPAQAPQAPAQKKAAAATNAMPTNNNPSEIDQISETFGHMLVNQLKATPLKLNIALIVKGMQDELAGKPSPMSQDVYDKAVQNLQQKVLTEIGAANLAAATMFMKENAKKEGVVTIVDNQLQYKILKEGSGAAVKAGATPQIHYEGAFIDGKVFGSSYATNEPVWLPLDQAIPGFAKGIVGMKEGEKRQLFIAPEMGYGPNGTANIPPNALLVFTVEVVKADKGEETPQQK